VAAGATLSAIFALVIATHIAVVLAADGLAEPNPAFELRIAQFDGQRTDMKPKGQAG
jgi:hypothetical protein